MGWAFYFFTRGIPLVAAESLTRASYRVDSMRELIHALRCDFLCLQDTQSERTRACVNLHISSLTCFSRHNFRTQHFYQNRYFLNKASVALNQLVSLFGRLVARSRRKRGNRQRTDRITNQVL